MAESTNGKRRWRRWLASGLLILISLVAIGVAVTVWYLPEIGGRLARRQLAAMDIEGVQFDVLALRPERAVIANLRLSGEAAPSVRRIDLTYSLGGLRDHRLGGIDVYGVEVTLRRTEQGWQAPGLAEVVAKLTAGEGGEPWEWEYLRLHRSRLTLVDGDRQAAVPLDLELTPGANGALDAALTIAGQDALSATYQPAAGQGTVRLTGPLDPAPLVPALRLVCPEGWRLDGLRGTLHGPLQLTLEDNRPARLDGEPEWHGAAANGLVPHVGTVDLAAARIGGPLTVTWDENGVAVTATPAIRDFALSAPERFPGRLAATDASLEIGDDLAISDLAAKVCFGRLTGVDVSLASLARDGQTVVARELSLRGPELLGGITPVLTLGRGELTAESLTVTDLALNLGGLRLTGSRLAVVPGQHVAVDATAAIDTAPAGGNAVASARIEPGQREFSLQLDKLRAGPWRVDSQDLRLTLTGEALRLQAVRLALVGMPVAVTDLELTVADTGTTATGTLALGLDEPWTATIGARVAGDGGHLRLAGNATPLGTPAVELTVVAREQGWQTGLSATLSDGALDLAGVKGRWQEAALRLEQDGGLWRGSLALDTAAVEVGKFRFDVASLSLPVAANPDGLQPTDGQLDGRLAFADLHSKDFSWKLHLDKGGLNVVWQLWEAEGALGIDLLRADIDWARPQAELELRLTIPRPADARARLGELGVPVPAQPRIDGAVEFNVALSLNPERLTAAGRLGAERLAFTTSDQRFAIAKLGVELEQATLPLSLAVLADPLAKLSANGSCRLENVAAETSTFAFEQGRLDLPLIWTGSWQPTEGALSGRGIRAAGLAFRPVDWPIYIEPDEVWMAMDITVDKPELTLHLTPGFYWADRRLEVPAEVEALPLDDLLTVARTISPKVPKELSISGDLRLEGQLIWRLDQVLARRVQTGSSKPWWHPEHGESGVTGKITNGRADWLDGKVTVNGVEGSLTLVSFVPLRSELHQAFHFDSGDFYGIPVEVGNFRIAVEDTTTVFLEGATISWCGGRLETHAVRFNPAAPDYTITVYADGVDAARVFALQDALRGEVQGTLYGRIPITIAGKSVRFTEGFLFSAPGQTGKLRLEEARTIADAAGDRDPRLELAGRALRNLDYDYLALRIDGSPDEFTELRIDLKGRAAEEPELPPVDVSIKVEAPIDELIKYGVSVDRLKRQLIE